MKFRVSAGFACAILSALALVHIYWASGGTAGLSAAIPTLEGRLLLHPGAMATLAVACALFAMSVLLAIRVGWIAAPSLFHATRFGAWLIAVLFALRAVGDFRYVGFFKTVRDRRFAELDTCFYSPLCVLLAVSVAFAALSSPDKNAAEAD